MASYEPAAHFPKQTSIFMKQRATITRGPLWDCLYYSFSGAVHHVPRSAEYVAGNCNGGEKVIGNSSGDRTKLFSLSVIILRSKADRLDHSMTITDNHLASMLLLNYFFLSITKKLRATVCKVYSQKVKQHL